MGPDRGPVVVDPDTGETLSGPAPGAASAPRRPVRVPWPLLAALLVGVVAGAAGGVSFEHGRTRSVAPTPAPTPASSPGPASTVPLSREGSPPAVAAGAYRATATGFVATLRIALPAREPQTVVTVSAEPLTPDPPVAVTLGAGQTRTVDVPLTPANACYRSASWNGIPTAFVVQAAEPGAFTQRVSVVLPYGLYRALLHALDTGCPP